jgi:hypothetical protein
MASLRFAKQTAEFCAGHKYTGYYNRVLLTKADCIPVSSLAEALKHSGSSAVIELDDASDE